MNSAADDVVEAASQSHSGLYRLYKRRWYILGLFSFFSFSQAATYNTWGPVSTTTNCLYKWTIGQTSLMGAWGAITFFTTGHLFMWILEKYGLRVGVLSCAFLVFLSGIFRVITFDPSSVFWTIQISQVLNGIAGTVSCFACTPLSAAWFPPEQRTLATGIGNAFNTMGMAFPMIFGPYMVQQRNCTEENKVFLFQDMKIYMWTSFCWGGALLVLLLIYFPARPPLPPSPSAASGHSEFWRSCRNILKMPQFWLLVMAYGVPLSFINDYLTDLNTIFSPLGISQDMAGSIGFWTTIASGFTSIAAARISDMFPKHMKVFLLVLFALGSLSWLWLVLLVYKYIQGSTVQLYASSITASSFLFMTSPLFFEFGCESLYPISETVFTGSLLIAFNFLMTPTLLLPLFPSLGSQWFTWGCMITAGLGLIPILLLKESYSRMKVDETGGGGEGVGDTTASSSSHEPSGRTCVNVTPNDIKATSLPIPYSVVDRDLVNTACDDETTPLLRPAAAF